MVLQPWVGRWLRKSLLRSRGFNRDWLARVITIIVFNLEALKGYVGPWKSLRTRT